MKRSMARGSAWWLMLSTGLVGAGGATLSVVGWSDLASQDSYTNLGGSLAAVFYAALGARVVRRVRNPIGWILLGVGLCLGIMCLASAYSIVGIVSYPGVLPGSELVGAIGEWTFVPTITGVAVMFLVFPMGTLPSRRWRPLMGFALALSALWLGGFIWAPRVVSLPAPGGVSLQFPNPLGVRSLGHRLPAPLFEANGLALISLTLLAGAFAALVVRYRAGNAERRQQIKWLALAAAGVVLSQLTAGASLAACGCAQTPLSLGAYLAESLIALFGVPAAISIAILRYRLYDIDRIINRAIVYGLLTALLAGAYVGLAVGLGSLSGSENSLVIAGSTLVVAALFRPARSRIQATIDRRFYRRKYDAERTLAAFGARLRDQVDLEELAVHLVGAVKETVQPVRASLWLRPGEGVG